MSGAIVLVRKVGREFCVTSLAPGQSQRSRQFKSVGAAFGYARTQARCHDALICDELGGLEHPGVLSYATHVAWIAAAADRKLAKAAARAQSIEQGVSA